MYAAISKIKYEILHRTGRTTLITEYKPNRLTQKGIFHIYKEGFCGFRTEIGTASSERAVKEFIRLQYHVICLNYSPVVD